MIGSTVSHYRIIDKLGEGGMGVVYRAEDTKLERLVALKFLSADLTDDAVARERFVREARAASALEHPNICTIHEIGQADDQIFIVMACVDGETLKGVLTRGPMPITEALDAAAQIADGLREAHEKGIVHRDIKPSNVMMTGRGLIKIMDFGLAKLAGVDDLTRARSTVGTVGYMSPEQHRGEDLDARSDIWSLGVLLYEMLTGRRPFAGKHQPAVLHAVLYEEPESLATLRPDASREIDALVRSMLEKNRRDRPRTAGAVLQQLARLAEPPGARDVTRITEIPDRGSSKIPERAPSIAVLPFRNMSADPEQEYFCDGMAEELINALVRIEGLRVVARTSSFAFKGQDADVREIGRRLAVEMILEGSVRKSDGRLRITAQLIDAADGYHVWSERYDRAAADVFRIQDEISEAIVSTLRSRLTRGGEIGQPRGRTADAAAYELYLQGRFHTERGTERSLKTAVEYFARAIERDPSYALAHAGLTDAYCSVALAVALPREEARARAAEAAATALTLGPDVAEVRSAVGWAKWMLERDAEGAVAELERAAALSPGDADILSRLALVLEALGRRDEAAEVGERAFALDPLSSRVRRQLVELKLQLWDWGRAEELLREAIGTDPQDVWSRHRYSKLLLCLGRKDEGLAELERARHHAGTGAHAGPAGREKGRGAPAALRRPPRRGGRRARCR